MLWLAGSGPKAYTDTLVRLAGTLGLSNSVRFWGRVSHSEKQSLMTQAHCLLMTSVREGWGLVVTEANACGTPAIVYDVGGLRDSVRDARTGLVVPPNPVSLSRAMVKVTLDPHLYGRLASAAKQWSTSFSFDQSAAEFRQVLQRTTAA